MLDQASGLRRLMGQGPRFQALGVFGTDPGLTALASAHLAHALARRGAPVWGLDEAAAPRNLATLFGLSPRQTLDQALCRDGDAAAAAMAVLPGLYLIAAGGGMAWLAGVPEMRWRMAVDDLLALPEQPHVLIMHAPAVREAHSLALCAPERLLVVPQGKACLTQAYALIKAVHLQHPVQRWHVLVMQAGDEPTARQTYSALEMTARRFLGIRLEWLGGVPRDRSLLEAARHLQPVQELPSGKPGVQAFRQLAETVMGWPGDAGMYKPEEFWLKMWMFSRLTAEAALEKVQDVQLS